MFVTSDPTLLCFGSGVELVLAVSWDRGVIESGRGNCVLNLPRKGKHFCFLWRPTAEERARERERVQAQENTLGTTLSFEDLIQ